MVAIEGVCDGGEGNRLGRAVKDLGGRCSLNCRDGEEGVKKILLRNWVVQIRARCVGVRFEKKKNHGRWL